MKGVLPCMEIVVVASIALCVGVQVAPEASSPREVRPVHARAWTLLLISRDCSDRGCQFQHRCWRTQTESRTCRGFGSLGRTFIRSSRSRGCSSGIWNAETHRPLTCEKRRPPMLRAPLWEGFLSFQPESGLHLSQVLLLKNLKCAKRRAAGGPSGMTAEHLRPVLESSRDAERFWSMCRSFARGDIPEEFLQAVRMGRITALQKLTGGVRGIVAGDIIRGFVARTIAQQLGPAIERATAPFQHALTTRAGCECIGHILQSETDASPNRTVLSIDGIGAFDLVSRESMMRGLLSVEGGQEALPFVPQFYGAPSTYLWQDDMGVVHEVHQGEGGEQGDALMPALTALLVGRARTVWCR